MKSPILLIVFSKKDTSQYIYRMLKPENKQISTNSFTSIRLDEMSQVKLMNRTDRKYWFHSDKLQHLLESIHDDYFALEIEGESQLPYTTTYYDTAENQMFAAHHNGKLNRYKIRRRSYVASQIRFLEVKFKSNKGRTIKKRMPGDFDADSFNKDENLFLRQHSPFNGLQLAPSLVNEFTRITLVNKNFKERCTIDFDLSFVVGNKTVRLDQLIIVEIKTDGYSEYSPLAMALREQRIKSSGFSKYCVGRTLTDPNLKRNAFKPKVRTIQKTLKTTQNFYNIIL